MAIRISSIIQNGGRDDDRLSGFTKDPAVTNIFGGMAVTQLTDPTGAGKVMTLFDGGNIVAGSTGSPANLYPLGLAIEPTTGFPGIAANGDTGAGLGFDTQDYAKGGIYSAFHRPGNLVDVYDDERNRNQVTINGAGQNQSCPFVGNLTYNVGDIIYATGTSVGQKGLLTNVASPSGSARFGIVRAVTNAGLSSPVLTIELHIALVP
jgi:hypothetical protein